METDYNRLYLHLFNRCSDVIDALEFKDCGKALRLLKTAQRECEEMYINDNSKFIYFDFGR